MELIATPLEGCYQIRPFFAQDERGTFVKTFHAERFAALGLPTEWREEYYSGSRKRVIRGMHFQTPPHDHEKLIYCMYGKVLDVVLDLRKKSTTFGKSFSIELDAQHGHGLIIPCGLAHGFLSLTDNALMAYKVTTVYECEHDKGIRWDSFEFDWGLTNPIVSVRDCLHPKFTDFISPF